MLLVGVLVLVVPLIVDPRELRHDRTLLVEIVAPLAAAVAWIAVYNLIRYGSVVDAGYHGQGFTTPLADGLSRIVAQPGKGFFWYDPLLLCALPGVVLLWRRAPALAVAVALPALARVVFFAAWYSPEGGVAWGPRLLFPLCALLVIPTGETWRWIAAQRPAWRALWTALVGVLAAAAALLTFASVWVPYEQFWHQIALPAPGEPQRAAAERVVRYYSDFDASHITGNLRLLAEARPFPLEHFAHGWSIIGVLSLVTATGATGIALIGARRADQRGS